MFPGLIPTFQTNAVSHFILGHLVPSAMLLAQEFQDTLGSDFQSAWDNFIESGQVWALLIGIVLGYMIRLFTSY